MNPKLTAAAVVALSLLVFTAQNYEVVALRILFWKIEMSRAIMILGVFGAGLGIGWLANSLKK